ncbi:hypothetical protein M9Y10_005150 [Tritrichomonas musculus]|uniref:Mediator of RNA polymerase II transcription subunit 9 n=1 Tax=Tritrichomonas musculus TaxID=1915356 RepID=A0ABR2JKG2_9EUKA
MSRRSKKFEFISIVRDLLSLLVNSDATDKEQEITRLSHEFLNKMEEAQKVLADTPGLDMTEEEQEQKIEDLQRAIDQKKLLIEECQRCFESWKDEE